MQMATLDPPTASNDHSFITLGVCNFQVYHISRTYRSQESGYVCHLLPFVWPWSFVWLVPDPSFFSMLASNASSFPSIEDSLLSIAVAVCSPLAQAIELVHRPRSEAGPLTSIDLRMPRAEHQRWRYGRNVRPTCAISRAAPFELASEPSTLPLGSPAEPIMPTRWRCV